jgi:ABC-type iron transport system FetAB ATPase subunit
MSTQRNLLNELKPTRVEAEYKEPPFEWAKGNPCCETLDEVPENTPLTSRMTHSVDLKKHNTKTFNNRLVDIEELSKAHIPTKESIRVARDLHCLLWHANRVRNPLRLMASTEINSELGKFIEEQMKATDDEAFLEKSSRRLARGSSKLNRLLIGPTGSGKTATLIEALKLIPQIIDHSEYHGKPFHFVQLNYVVCSINVNSKLSGFCQDIVRAIDTALGTTYFKDRLGSKGNVRTAVALGVVHELVNKYNIGMLILDEAQNLARVNNLQKHSMLNMLLHVTSSLQVGVVMTSTPEIRGLLENSTPLVRRLLTGGKITFDPFYYDPSIKDSAFEQFLRRLWKINILANPPSLKKQYLELIYKSTWGIQGLIIELLIGVQKDALTNEMETFGLPELKRASEDYLEDFHYIFQRIMDLKTAFPSVYPDMDIRSIHEKLDDPLLTQSG